MAKFRGKLGFFLGSAMTSPGVHTDSIVEKEYTGDVLRESRQWATTIDVSDELKLGNRISIMADSFVRTNMSVIRYALYNGVYWKVTNIEEQRPRLILTLGGIYNGHKA